ncbi:MAG: hypothetical protein FVQ83_01870 [Chloroflexi bacterium]|nr:hypothetical protein [Chloroflexota bacterium]
MRENLKLAQLIYQVGRDGVPNEDVSERIRKTLEAEWKAKWPPQKTGFLRQGLFGWLSPKKSEWRSTRQREKTLTIGLALFTIIVMVMIVFTFPADNGGLPGAANQGGLFPLIVFSLLALGIAVWWFVKRKR